MAEPLVYCEIENRIAKVFINHPPLNALDMPTRLALEEVFQELEQRQDEIAAVVLAGAGDKAFAAGADIKAFLELTPATAKERTMRTHEIYGRIENFVRPVIAAVHGFCLGGGLELALACDIRYADPGATFGFPEVNLAVFPGNGGTARALHFLTVGRFKELVFSGKRIDAQQAVQYGLIEEVTPQGKALERALELAAQIAKKGPLGVAAAKQVINRTRDLPLAQGLDLESDAWSRLTDTEDIKEGARAFMDKRKPAYKGR